MLKLQFKDQRQPAIWLSDERFTIGHDPKNNLHLKEQDVAAFHAEIRRENDQYYLDDAGTNRTFVNGELIHARYQLRRGDNIKIANVEFELSSPVTEDGGNSDTQQDWSIQAINGELKGQSFPITGSMTLGRSSSCEICIHDDRISRRHSELHVKEGILRLKDLGSANGTLVNRKKVTEVSLSSGDQIQFDSLTFLVIGPTHVDAVEPQDEEDMTVFSVAPLKKPAPVIKATPKVPKQQPIKRDTNANQQASMEATGQTPNPTSVAPDLTAIGWVKAAVIGFIVIATTVGIGSWFFLK
ncbi:MAG: FHA domain-containing protein [Pseudomonadales bacterium]|nr:FHA domain-containing protein [Pseudomonadales bacterium]